VRAETGIIMRKKALVELRTKSGLMRKKA